MNIPRKQRHTAQRIYDRLIAEYPNEMDVKLRTVQYYVSKKKKQLMSQRSKAYLPLLHPPGEAQVDFCQFFYYDNAKVLQEARKLTVSFPHSNAGYCQIFKGENQECLLQGIKNIINHIGKVPFRMVFDNLSAAVTFTGKGKERKLTEGFTRFMEHYKIEAAFCNPASGWEKGNVENKVGYERRNMFVPVPTILDFDQFNKRLLQKCEEDMNRHHYNKQVLISELFEIDKSSMSQLNPIDFKVSKFQMVKADKYAKVMFETNIYSSSPKLAQQNVYLEITSDSVSVMDQDYQSIVMHKRLYGKNLESMDWLPYISLMAKRPTALKYTGFYQQLPASWQEYLSDLTPEKKKEALLTLNTMLQKHDIESAVDALEIALKIGVKDCDSILASYHRLTSSVIEFKPMQLSDPYMHIPSFQTDNSKYDALFSQEAKS